ncbi:MAG: hypothetical protein MJZ79_04695 [Paludibacteraceae bacterium]|nr:hypothetical protein [Paludibacteraceae bacterium]
MIPRIYKLEDDLEQSVFLFGARQTGKSTYLKTAFPNSRCIIVSRDPFTRRTGDIEIMYIFDFLQKLWKGEII